MQQNWGQLGLAISCKQSLSSHSTGLFPQSQFGQLWCCSILPCWNLSWNWHIQTWCSAQSSGASPVCTTTRCKCCYSLLTRGSQGSSGLKVPLVPPGRRRGPSLPLSRPAAAPPPQMELWGHPSSSQEAPGNPLEHNSIFRWTEKPPLPCSVAFE